MNIEQFGNLNIWWFPKNFCQSRYGEHYESGTNSCTLISLIIANRISNMNAFNQDITQMPSLAWQLIGDSINDGNFIYRGLNSTNLNINIPDALKAIRSQHHVNFQLEEWFFTQVKTEQPNDLLRSSSEISRLFSGTLRTLRQTHDLELPRYLFGAMIADCRTVMISIDLITYIVAIIDSHQHGYNTGAVLAQTKLQFLNELMLWYINMLDSIYTSRPNIYEISFLTTEPNVSRRIPAPFNSQARRTH